MDDSTTADERFKQAPEQIQRLLRDILAKERQKRFDRRRHKIHQDILSLVKLAEPDK